MRRTHYSAGGRLSGRALLVTTLCEALETMYSKIKSREERILLIPRGMEARQCGMVKILELLLEAS